MTVKHPITPTLQLAKPVFTVSLDFELLWGTADRPYSESFERLCAIERERVFDRLLSLVAASGISATWAVVGKLFLHDGGRDPLRHAADLVERIRRCPVPQEIGSHTLTHAEIGNISRQEAQAELEGWARLARLAGVEYQSIVFPRNCAGHADVVRGSGFRCFRGKERTWYAACGRPLRRLGHLADILTARTPPTVLPRLEDGLWNIPGSMLYTPAFGVRRILPVWLRVLRANRGLDRAIRRREVFHLWFHPTDLARRTDAMLDGLRRIFERAARLRDAGTLDILPMRALLPANRKTLEEDAVHAAAQR
jgi:hypothetical protein